VQVLVTGGAGFIGSNFVHYALEAHPDWEIVNLDKLTYAGNPANIADLRDHPRHRFVRGDICDPEVVEQCMREVDIVINFAAESHIDRSIADPSDFIMTDMYGAYVLLEAARKFAPARFLQISTVEVYGEAGEVPPDEEGPLRPKSPYAASKAGGDRLCYSYFTTYGTPVVIVRCVNNYGPYQYPEKVIPLFVTNAIDNEPLPLYGSGNNTREWVAVLDHCRALDLLAAAEGIEGEVFNIGSGVELSVWDLARRILQHLGKPPSLARLVEDRPGHVRRIALNWSKIRKRLGWEPQIDIEAGLSAAIEWYRQHQEWWRPIKSGAYKRFYQQQYAERLRSREEGHD